MTAAFSSPPRVAASGSRRSTTPQRHVFHEPLVIRPMSPMRRFWGGTCRAIAVGLFWLLVALVACRILLPGVFKAGAALAPTPQPVTVPKKQADGTTVNVLSPTHEALLSGMGACSITQDAATCPFASASDLAATSAALGAVEERVRGMQALKEQVEGLSGALDALKASGVDRDGETKFQLETLKGHLEGKLAQAVEELESKLKTAIELVSANYEQAAGTAAMASANNDGLDEKLSSVQASVDGLSSDVDSLAGTVSGLQGDVATFKAAAEAAEAAASAASKQASEAIGAAHAAQESLTLASATVSATASDDQPPTPVAVEPDEAALIATVTELAQAHVGEAVRSKLAAETGSISDSAKQMVADAVREALDSADVAASIQVAVQGVVADALSEGSTARATLDGAARDALMSAIQGSGSIPEVAEAAQAVAKEAVGAALPSVVQSASVDEAAREAITTALQPAAAEAATGVVESTLAPWVEEAKASLTTAAATAVADASATQASTGPAAGDTSALARQFPASLALATLGAFVEVGPGTTGTALLEQASADVLQHCSTPIAGEGRPSVIRDLLNAASPGDAVYSSGAGLPSAQAVAKCRAAKQLTAQHSLPFGKLASSNPDWLTLGTRPVPGEAWVVDAGQAEVTLRLAQPAALARVGLLFPTKYQAHEDSQCMPSSVTLQCVDGDRPVPYASGTLIADPEAGEAWVDVEAASQCMRFKATFFSNQQRICVYRLVLQA